jgi:hypothetical protein
VDGEKITTLRGGDIAQDFRRIVEDYVARKYALRGEGESKAGRREIPIRAV